MSVLLFLDLTGQSLTCTRILHCIPLRAKVLSSSGSDNFLSSMLVRWVDGEWIRENWVGCFDP